MIGIVRGMKEILRIPLTLKMRTGIQNNKLTAHKLFPQIACWGNSIHHFCINLYSL